MVQYKYDFDEDATPVNVPPHVSSRDQMYDAVKRMFDMPQFKDTKFQFRWNNVILTMDKNTTRDDLVRQYNEQDAAYEQTPEYKARIAAEEARQTKLKTQSQAKADALVKDLPATIKKGEAAVVDWLDDLSKQLDCHGVDVDQEAVAYQLRQSGICPIKDLEEDDVGDAALVAQNLISYAVKSMERHAGLYPHTVQTEAGRYREIKKTGKDTLGTFRKMDILSRQPRPRP